ncbi:flagellin [bacterium]|nr:flagellin [bacterium]
MAVRIIQNIPAMIAARNVNNVMHTIGDNMEQLSTGYRINHASDDAAGLEISEVMRSQVRGLAQAERNIMDGISLIQTAEAGLIELTDMIQRIRELAVQSSNATYTSYDRSKIQLEIDQITSEITRLASSVQFNTRKILTGMSFTFQVGANYSNTIGIKIATVSAQSLGLWDSGIHGYGLHSTDLFGDSSSRTIGYMPSGSFSLESAPVWDTSGGLSDSVPGERQHAQRNGLHIDSKDAWYEMGVDVSSKRSAAESSLVQLDSALHSLTFRRAQLGAMQNRLEHTLNAVGIAKEQQAAAESRIRDLDIAQKSMDLTREQILLQTSTAMLAQANTLPSIALSLI